MSATRTKPKVVCVIGSAILAPLTIVTFAFIGAMAVLLILGPLTEPAWLRRLAGAVALIFTPITIYNLYGWYFKKCYRPAGKASAGLS